MEKSDVMHIARSRCDGLRRELREIENFIRFGESLLGAEAPRTRPGDGDAGWSAPKFGSEGQVGMKALGGRE